MKGLHLPHKDRGVWGRGRSILSLLILWMNLSSSLLQAQEEHLNLVTATMPRVPVTTAQELDRLTAAEAARTLTCYDGLGRISQNVQVAASPDKNDVVTAYTWDIAGRREKEFLPYVRNAGTKGHIATDPLTEQRSFYQQPPEGIPPTSFPYARKIFDRSPLSRILEKGAPGKAWQPAGGHPVRYNITVNLEPVPRWTLDSKGRCSPSSSYPPGSLLVKEVHDEDGHLSKEYIDKRGRTILKERWLDSLPVRTFYVYDDRDLLRAVIPPMAAAEGYDDDRYVFRYTYDDRRRMTTKKIPGAAPVEMVYDNMDRLVMSCDGNLRRDSLWRYTLYDAFGRIIQSGLCKSRLSRTALQKALDTRTGPVDDTTALPAYAFQPLEFFFYDDYSFVNDTALLFHEEDLADIDPAAWAVPPEPWQRSDKTKSLRTGQRVKIPATGQWLTSVTYYDALGRAIQTIRQNHLGGTDRVSTLYDFSGNILKSILTHTSRYGNKHTVIRTFTYDHANRLLRIRYRFDTLPEVILVENSYDDLGRLKEKKFHGKAGTFAESQQYRYNVRGWLTAINDPDSLGDHLFAEELLYENPASMGVDSLFSGNISAIRWRTPSLGHSVAYAFSYDGLSRLTQALWKERGNPTTGDHSVPLIAYDLNGNIDTLLRIGAVDTARYGIIDALQYHYDGNQLIAVDDAATNEYGHYDFRDRGSRYDPTAKGPEGSPEYLYDANGNMVRDANKKILRVRYDHNNLPREILFEKDRKIIYIYDATGVKLRKEVYAAGGHLVSVTDYDGPFVYTDGELAYVLTGEGRLVNEDEQGWQWEYFLKDHLGSVRIAFRPDSANHPVPVQETHYYPFGMPFSATTPATTDHPNPYLYNAKELQPEHGLNWYDYDARYYDPSLARFLVNDPKSETYSFQSTYIYAKNNPIYFFEVFGLGPGPFSGRAYKISGGVRVYRITRKQRKALNIYTASFIAFGGRAGTIANLTSSFGGFIFEGLLGGTKRVSEELARDPIVGPNRKKFFRLSKSIKTVKSIINVGSVLKEVIDNKTTKQEILENATFQFATHLMPSTYINIVNPGLLDIYNDNADPKTIEYGLNTIYNTLEEKLSSFDLSTKKGMKEAFEYLKKNYSDIIIDIKNNYENAKNDEN